MSLSHGGSVVHEVPWVAQADVVVVGSGIAGLVAALRAAEHGQVMLVTKGRLDLGSTRLAQGGIAAALAPEDSAIEHLADTLTAGVGLCDIGAVQILVTEGPGAVQRLVNLGVHFDLAADKSFSLGHEGGHDRRRIAHAGGDATGAEISRALLAALERTTAINVLEYSLVLDLIVEGGRAVGVSLYSTDQGHRRGLGAIQARAVVLATGGFGQVFTTTTNPDVATGDGVALALRAGAEVADMEFIQFHPTVLWLGEGAQGSQPLISEAVRGEGAYLIDASGNRFMTGRHNSAELAPRDIVARGIMHQMRETGEPYMLLDGRHLGSKVWETRFPNILSRCREHGIDPVTQPIPVAPAAHYANGGIRTDHHGRTSIPALYACGEVACTGVHGANRLASNSLLEGLVFAERVADVLPESLDAPSSISRPIAAHISLLDPSIRRDIQHLMSTNCGILRSNETLTRAHTALANLSSRTYNELRPEAIEATSLHTVASTIVTAASIRTESRGSHWRQDHLDRDDQNWLGHLLIHADGSTISTNFIACSESCTA